MTARKKARFLRRRKKGRRWRHKTIYERTNKTKQTKKELFEWLQMNYYVENSVELLILFVTTYYYKTTQIEEEKTGILWMKIDCAAVNAHSTTRQYDDVKVYQKY